MSSSQRFVKICCRRIKDATILKLIFSELASIFQRTMADDLFWEYPKLQLDISNKELKIGQGALREQIQISLKREINIMEVLKGAHRCVYV